MEAITHQLALRLREGNFGRKKLPRYFQGGNLVRIKLPNTTASFSAAATTTPKLAQPIHASAGGDTTPVSSDPDTLTEMASHDPAIKDTRIAQISSAIRVIPDFPKPGIMFQDITTLLLDPKAFKDTIDLFVERYQDKKINVVAGIEARGFIFGPPIALAIGAKFVPMRKPKKLPGEVISEEYSLEYGTDVIEMHVGAVQDGERVLIIDDLIATGGTLGAAIRLIERVGGTVVECACVIELPELKGRARLGDKPLFVLVSST
ncbi:PREDICTED: adenine phosphoribosyltransferase 1-like [Ipomoea nil]|uniref:adenine phosphoribosyltransferase 1-like n=1 Tax=Ipomoea nil TaxID=35883 RepID=UPI0009016719|nr:PREDICTED: adenine phosphoribosyltransferase 1-like [Ipomoea nil]XP_019152987.1 PREDICTED: adenine phosphoribosyltransferase 1-like [Ipomoea nil]XP_019152988.1 PREDICTED: adenine phosphoribosyltransferase 1-like [Ipomoea nil]XP_019152989.1 PREDICTED: adenine phosphoribosyltransferase 1-like [Ipomoea nil]